MSKVKHIPVLLKETIDGLEIKDGDVILDATLGGGGHSSQICKDFGEKVTYLGIDADEEAVKRSIKAVEDAGCTLKATIGNFRNLDSILDEMKVSKVNKMIFDLGLSSYQIAESGRGFSFQKDEPLTMTLASDPNSESLNAYDIVNNWSPENIKMILRTYGEERFTEKIVNAIVKRRVERPIETTLDLAGIIMKATPFWYHSRKIHPATKTFQALRITVNDEIRALEEALGKGFERLQGGGRIAVISFQSIEDRIVKKFFRYLEDEQKGRRLNKKPTVASEEEKEKNPRSRSAKLRIFIKN